MTHSEAFRAHVGELGVYYDVGTVERTRSGERIAVRYGRTRQQFSNGQEFARSAWAMTREVALAKLTRETEDAFARVTRERRQLLRDARAIVRESQRLRGTR
jgi:hypothetical protein